MSIRYSIIIPHFQQITQLKRCLKSLPFREDMEVIVVDDASDGATVHSLEEMKSENKRGIHFAFSNRNKGAGHSRNIGLGMAKGEYVIFADADDYFMPDFDNFLNRHASCNSDVLYFNASYKAEGGVRLYYKSANLNYIMDKPEPERSFELRFLFTEPWCKMVRRSMIEANNIRFDETRIHNDVHFSNAVGVFAATVEVDDTPEYCVVETANSVAKQMSTDRLKDWTSVQTRQNLFFRNNGVKIFEYKALRPFIASAIKGRFKDSLCLYRIMHDEGLSHSEIIIRTLIYPIAALRKAIRNHNKKKHIIWA